MTARLICQLLVILTISSDSMSYDSIKRKQKLRSNTLDLPAIKQKVLLYIAENGETNIYQIGEQCQIGYSTAHSSIKALEKQGLVQLRSERKNEKGVIAKSYVLTINGLYQSIYAKHYWHEKILIAEKRKDLVGKSFLEWMKLIQSLNNSEIEHEANTQIGYYANENLKPSLLELQASNIFLMDDFSDTLFDLIILTAMITNNNVLCDVLKIIESYPSIKSKLKRQNQIYMEGLKRDMKRLEIIKASFEKSNLTASS
jgi:predicted transcriptional regulator